MFSECVEEVRWGKSTWERYELQLRDQMLAAHPEWDTRGYVRNYGIGRLFAQDGKEWSWVAYTTTLERSSYPNPFSKADLPQGGADTGISPEECAMYILVFEKSPENGDGDGIIAGEAYLFYEVGGQDPLIFDGDLKELRFNLPPLAEQEGFRQISEDVKGAVGNGCLRVLDSSPLQPGAEVAYEAFNAWVNQYANRILAEALGKEVDATSWIPYDTPEFAQSQCVVLLYRSSPDEEVLLIYETKNGLVTVSLGVLVYDPWSRIEGFYDTPEPTSQPGCEPDEWLNSTDPILIYAEPDLSSSVVGEIPQRDLENVGFGPEGPVCRNGYVWLPVWSEEMGTIGWIWTDSYP